MLVLTRKLMERLYIGDNICITVVRLDGGQVRLGTDAPREVRVVRGELTERDRAESPRPERHDETLRPTGPAGPYSASDRPSRNR